MHTLADREDYADILEVIPAFSSCTRNVLDEFVNYSVVKVHCAAGGTFSSESGRDENLYVLVSGSALLDAGDGVFVALEPGDYFGTSPARQHQLVTSVAARTDIEVLVINPLEVARLARASSMDRHPSRVDWRSELRTTTRRAERRTHRRAVLVGQGV